MALETVSLWCRRSPITFRTPRFPMINDSEPVEKYVEGEQKLSPGETVAIKGSNTLNSILLLKPDICSYTFLRIGVIGALVHLTTSSCHLLQASSCCCLQNLSACRDEVRTRIAEEGGVSLLVDLA
eukprot:CAMPEP_0113670824 /NCGR_PEP_ID=MMETSP0038_2-20120614/5358_1 /TAXON_ID=2898 /ORGANISM="Cryptomonas paramecium" /LENGTH=125 /DNA_ID=CAMNT_0000586897 /DNA_START=164 /DNA_END=538 /DNA_ORIENTATION=- /assembly_acc=CAM_ASM_000170